MTASADSVDQVADEPDRGVLGMPHDLSQVIFVHHDIAVAYEYVRMPGFSIGGDKVVYFRIESGMALFNHKGYVPVGVFVLHFLCYFVGLIVEVLEAKKNFVFGIVLGAEA